MVMTVMRALCLVALLVCVGQASASVAEHHGANDPTTEGWSMLGNASLGSPDTDLDAWIVDQPVGKWCQYAAAVSSADLSSLESNGWVFTVDLADLSGPDHTDPAIPGVPSWTVFAIFSDAGHYWGFALGTDGAGDALVRPTDGANTTYSVGVDAPEFHRYAISKGAGASEAEVRVDGSLVASFTGIAASEKGVYWGSGQTDCSGIGAYRTVFLTAAPGLPAFALVGAAPALGAVVRKLRKR